MGRHCRELDVTLRIAELSEDDRRFHDAAGTWLTGHGERIVFGRPYVAGARFLVDATVSVPCKYLKTDSEGNRAGSNGGASTARCLAHGFEGRFAPDSRVPRSRTQNGNGTFTVVHNLKTRRLSLPPAPKKRRTLPVLGGTNPCLGAPCRTADNKQGAACCRDLTLELMLPRAESMRESLLRARRSPYLCKVSRENDEILECEVISACDYLGADGITCVLHGRVRPDGTPAKPSICSEWPDLEPGEPGHTGCRLAPGVVSTPREMVGGT